MIVTSGAGGICLAAMFESVTSTLASLNPFASPDAAAVPAPMAEAAAGAPAAMGAGGGVGDWFKGLFDHGEPGLGDAVKENRKDLHDRFALESAKEDLKGKFKIGDGTGPNAVSPEEFEKVAKMYSDIREGKSDIKLDTDEKDPVKAAELKKKAMDDMGTMLTTPAGRKLVGDLASNETVDPNDPTKKIHHQTAVHLTNNPDKVNDCDEKGMAMARQEQDAAAGAKIEQKASTPGVGVDAEVTFHPGVTKMLDGPNVVSTGDTALFHELVHADHMTHGTKIASDQRVNDFLSRDNGAKKEELATVGLGDYKQDYLTENEYRRERAQLDPMVQQRPSYN